LRQGLDGCTNQRRGGSKPGGGTSSSSLASRIFLSAKIWHVVFTRAFSRERGRAGMGDGGVEAVAPVVDGLPAAADSPGEA
jgi:hypothetical protein